MTLAEAKALLDDYGMHARIVDGALIVAAATGTNAPAAPGYDVLEWLAQPIYAARLGIDGHWYVYLEDGSNAPDVIASSGDLADVVPKLASLVRTTK